MRPGSAALRACVMLMRLTDERDACVGTGHWLREGLRVAVGSFALRGVGNFRGGRGVMWAMVGHEMVQGGKAAAVN